MPPVHIDVYIQHTMRRKIPSLQALACFDAAARHQSYTRAAQELALTQSAVSRQVGALEDYLGQALFRRTRHGVTLTEAGANYARQIAPRLQALERDTLDAMTGLGGGSGGAVYLAVVPTFAARWLIPRLPQFAAQHPNALVHMDTRTRPFMFSDTEFDAAIMALTPSQAAQWAGTRATVLLPEVVIAVCAPALLGGLGSTLAGAALLQQSTRPEAWREWFESQAPGPNTDQNHTLAAQQSAIPGASALTGPRFEQFSMTAAAAVNGLGVALIPRLLIEAELACGDLVQAHPFALSGQRYYYWVEPDRANAAASAIKPGMVSLRQWLQALCATGQPSDATNDPAASTHNQDAIQHSAVHWKI
jgi:DNA-binding transcriptional LysR family regulator